MLTDGQEDAHRHPHYSPTLTTHTHQTKSVQNGTATPTKPNQSRMEQPHSPNQISPEWNSHTHQTKSVNNGTATLTTLTLAIITHAMANIADQLCKQTGAQTCLHDTVHPFVLALQAQAAMSVNCTRTVLSAQSHHNATMSTNTHTERHRQCMNVCKAVL